MRAMGFPLYVNGQLLAEPVTISHVPGPAEAQGVLGGTGIDPSMGALGAYALYRPTRGLRGLGADAAPAPLSPEAQPALPPPPGSMLVHPGVRLLLGLIGVASVAGLAYHGYKRNDSIGWSIGWALLGGAFPIIAWPVALGQGFAKRKSLTPNRRRSRRRRSRRRR